MKTILEAPITFKQVQHSKIPEGVLMNKSVLVYYQGLIMYMVTNIHLLHPTVWMAIQDLVKIIAGRVPICSLCMDC